MNRRPFFHALAAALMLTLASTPGSFAQKDSKKKEFAFHGKVEKVDAEKKTVTVNNASIPGWMSSMSMTYALDKPDAVETLKPGDQITAKVFEDDYKVLYDVTVDPAAPPAEKDPNAKNKDKAKSADKDKGKDKGKP